MTRFLRITLLFLAAGVAPLVILVGSSLWMVQANNNYSREILDLRIARSAILNVLLTLQDAERGQRGFVMTQDPNYLEPYSESTAQLPERLRQLHKATAAIPAVSRRIEGFDAIIDEKMKEMAGTIDLVRSGQRDRAVELIRTDRGLQLMEDARSTMDDALDQVDDRLRVIVAEQIEVAANLKWTTVSAAVAIVLVLAIAFFVIREHIRALSQARAEVEVLNAGLEERISERTQDLMRANQEIQRFAYVVTHDLRAPLVNIMGFLSELENALKSLTTYVLADGKTLSEQQVMDARTAVNDDLPEAIGFIRSSTRKMDQLINAILKISRDGRRKLMPEQIDLKLIADNAAASIHHQIISAGGSITCDFAKARHVVSDRITLDQIFGNLFDNAVKYQDPSRPLVLEVHSYPVARGRIGVDVKDNGRGIGPQDLERVFELFRRAGNQDQPGEGIGLAHVRSLIRNLGGDITVESELGKGSTFKLVMPLDLTMIVRSTAL
ncbi:MAG: histidine kinase [Shinella sp.]|nr:MAG: histidine kinase [Shinella sp.]